MTKADCEDAGFFDASVWEESQKKGDLALKRLINGALSSTSNTCLLVGSQTYLRPWVRYEIMKSSLRGSHLLAVHINCIKGKDQKCKGLGPNPFDYMGVTYSEDGRTGTFNEVANGEWVKYDKIDSSANFSVNGRPEHRGKGFKLLNFFKLHDWVAHGGYDNFATWLK